MVKLMCCCAGGWDDKFLQQESELRRVRSEKANLEQHILGMESELEALQEERTKVTAEMESQRKVASCTEQQMESLRTEVSLRVLLINILTLSFFVRKMTEMFLQTIQLRSELVACSEERDDLNQSLSQWREKVHNLEKTNGDIRGLISILEDDVRAGRKEYDGLKNSTDKLKAERLQVQRRA